MSITAQGKMEYLLLRDLGINGVRKVAMFQKKLYSFQGHGIERSCAIV